MPQSFTCLRCHTIFSTRGRRPGFKARLYSYLGGILSSQKGVLLEAEEVDSGWWIADGERGLTFGAAEASKSPARYLGPARVVCLSGAFRAGTAQFRSGRPSPCS
jgi:hypothetical protein